MKNECGIFRKNFKMSLCLPKHAAKCSGIFSGFWAYLPINCESVNSKNILIVLERKNNALIFTSLNFSICVIKITIKSNTTSIFRIINYIKRVSVKNNHQKNHLSCHLIYDQNYTLY